MQAGDAAPPLAGELENPAGSERRYDLAAMLGPEEEARADALALELRKAGIPAEVSFRRSNPGNQMKRADALGARFALVLGDAELKSGRAKLKELKSGAEHEVDLSDLPGALRRLQP